MQKVQELKENWACTGVIKTLTQSSHLSRYCLVMLCIVISVFCAGCKSDKKTATGAIDFRLNLSNPEVQGREVNVNGGVAVPVERIQWEWGDGQIERHRFFPSEHTYAQPGKYKIIVTAFDSKGLTASQSVTVEIK
jgi:hypothetical protein